MNCCVNCFKNEYIKKFIISNNQKGKCTYCHSQNAYISNTEDLGYYIYDKVSRAYSNIYNTEVYDMEKMSMYLGMNEIKEVIRGISTFELLRDKEDIFSEEVEDIKRLFNALTYNDTAQKRFETFNDNRDILIFDDGYTHYGYTDNEYKDMWNYFKCKVKYITRYFDLQEDCINRKELLNGIKEVLLYKSLILNLNEGKYLFRSRNLEDKDINLHREKQKLICEIGPSPSKYVKNNRMSPAGISYMYVAENADTTIREIRPKIGDNILLGKFKLKKDLKILNLSEIPNMPMENLFSPKYNHSLIFAKEFLIEFTKEISKPMKKEDNTDVEYVPTQVLAEYIKMLGYDGIKYESSLEKDEYNYVLFCSTPECNMEILGIKDGLKTFTEWMKLVELKKIKLDINNIVLNAQKTKTFR
ncbi:RES domain-containing protein [Clostridium tagluense]|uniref:RES domain-containing protein n=1 Tax=Clostridium tagluense TaxID=360422 RepID=A0A401ULD3_9CLOT|nr:RES domain-containing protein [Clostridium tagluense]GCD10347.1 hypothetical protein Ctaglu_19700 [Clostridium tagluense]